jgi:pumilio RNA-binding family
MNNPFMVNTNMNNYNAFNNIRNISIPIQNNIQTKTQKKRNSFSIPVPNYFYNEDNYILENLNSYLTDQSRCRQIQEKLEEKKNDSEFIIKFYQNIESNLVDIINHQFGNYVIQKFFDIILFQKNQNLITQFFLKIQSDLFKISVNNYGTRVFQKSLEKLDNGIYEQIETPELNNIIKNLVEKHIFALCYDKNGNHVFQKIARIFPKDRNQFIFDLLNQYAIEISKLKQGATILQNTFKYASNVQLKSLILKILSDIGALVNDEYGNYTIQLIIELKEKEYNDIIYDYLIKNCLSLSKKKFSSNVIDKCIIGEDENSKKLVNYIIKNKYVKEMINDQFGNYVIQKALKVSDYDTQIEIINQIKPQIEQLRQTNIGRKIYEHLMQSYNDFFKDITK